jgi:A/G-specific adenine glycosylase
MPKKHSQPIPFAKDAFQSSLLTWYAGARRTLPWRALTGMKPDPYRVWLSEVMLQQTTVAAVIPYFKAFLERWPTVEALGAAKRDEVLAAWAGLGYYSRARNLHACAQLLSMGGFPEDEASLRQLPGVGVYTAAAIAAIAFDIPASAADGNVERVIARLFAIEMPLPSAKPQIRELAASLVPVTRPGDYAQAMMDLGAAVCTPRSPSCGICPLKAFCLAGAMAEPSRFPVKSAKAIRAIRRGDAFVIVRTGAGGPHILLRRRPEKGLLGGMMEVPCTEWAVDSAGQTCGAQPSRTWRQTGTVRHTFTHFHLEMRVFAAGHRQVAGEANAFGGEWAPLAGLERFALPTVMKKAVASGLTALGIDAPGLQRAGKKSL